jgi:hypothetical protein
MASGIIAIKMKQFVGMLLASVCMATCPGCKTAPELEVTITPPKVTIPDNSKRGTRLATVSVRWSDGAEFTGNVRLTKNPGGICAAAAFAAVDEELEFAARNLGASAFRTALTVTLPLAAPGLMAAAIFVFLESLDEFTGTYFVGVPDVTTLPLIMFTASLAGNYQIAAVTALILLVPSIAFMLLIERFLNTEMLAKVR